jgi:hypothetical protein
MMKGEGDVVTAEEQGAGGHGGVTPQSMLAEQHRKMAEPGCGVSITTRQVRAVASSWWGQVTSVVMHRKLAVHPRRCGLFWKRKRPA